MKKVRKPKEYRIKAFQRREIPDRYRKIYDDYTDTLDNAYQIAYVLAEHIGDIYGFSYVTISDKQGNIIDTIEAIYNSDISTDFIPILKR